jgi:16S rRNA C967 or C1407 C5-methylase (RsmB/RsmF family)/NOL1/NOP2/fmu family ribosome biogenesis protein
MMLPPEFETRMRHQLSDDYTLFASALEQDSPVSVRIHPSKLKYVPKLERVNWCNTGYYLSERPLFSSDPLWHAGTYYVQESSSMMIEAAFLKVRASVEGPLKVLDLCAAPGGKSTLLANLLSEDDVLVSNEVIRSRVPVLYENLTKNGYPNLVITNADSSDFEKLGGVFDLVLVDAPCSGEGLFRKDPDAVNEWNSDNVQTCELRQKRILESVSACVKTGGYIIYSTCTYNPGENEHQVELLQSKGFESVSFTLNGSEKSSFQCYPHLIKGEGFYIALLKNTKDQPAANHSGKHQLKLLKADPAWQNMLINAGEFFDFKGQILAIQPHVFEFFSDHLSGLHIYSIGISVGTQKDRLFSPSPYLPFASNINTDAFDSYELDQTQALSYLFKNAISITQRDKKGYVLLTFKSHSIGLGKYAGNRINNLYPAEWKLRKMPETTQYFTLLND